VADLSASSPGRGPGRPKVPPTRRADIPPSRKAEVPPTRRADIPPGRKAEVPPTRRVQNPLTLWPEALPTREPGAQSSRSGQDRNRRASGGAEDPHGLPPQLTQRFDLTGRPYAEGRQASLWRVRDSGKDRILKVYQPGMEPELADLQRCARVDSPYLAGVAEVGRAGGRVYELMEYAGRETLMDLIDEHPDGLPIDMVRTIVRQLTAALTELHRHQLAHLDVKPANILLRSRKGTQVALADYGATTQIDQTLEFRTWFRTCAYSAPERFANAVSFSCDWWSLGVVAAELASGRHPFEGISEEIIVLQIVQGVVPIPDGIDESVHLLCEGLIVNQLAVRWGAEEVGRWLAGDPPPPPTERGPQAAHRTPFVFDGKRFTERAPLAAALAVSGNWGKAARSLFDPIGERWFELRDWLGQFDDPGDRMTSRELAARLERDRLPPNVALLSLLRWMDPGATASYRGYRMSVSAIAGVAEQAARAEQPVYRGLVADLWEHQLLPELDHAPDGHGLTQIDARWRQLSEAWDRATARLRTRQPHTATALSPWRGLALRTYLLWLAADPRADRLLRGLLATEQGAIRRDLGGRARLDWFDEVVAGAPNPAARLAAYAVAPLARTEAQRIRARRQAAQAAYAERVQLWQRQERWRALDRPIAVGWAAAGVGILAIGWTVLILLSSATGIASAGGITRAWMFMVIAIVLQTGAELWLAAIIGAPYHPDYSLFMGVSRAAGVTGRRFMHRGLAGFAVISVTAAALLAATIFVPFLLPLAFVPAHAGWVYVRYGRWRRDYQRRRSNALRRASARRVPAAEGRATTGGPR
jgi:eukaryotic-like serine/threonine-protein kinase